MQSGSVNNPVSSLAPCGCRDASEICPSQGLSPCSTLEITYLERGLRRCSYAKPVCDLNLFLFCPMLSLTQWIDSSLFESSLKTIYYVFPLLLPFRAESCIVCINV